jgi:hypothetical protein
MEFLMKNGLSKVDVYTYEDSDEVVKNNTRFLEDQDNVSLDDWKPTESKYKIISSDWRKNEIGDNFNQRPELDDLLKIRKYLKKEVPDYQIMEAFGISSDILLAIKKDKYCPVEGILKDLYSQQIDDFKKQINSDFRDIKKKVAVIAKQLDILAKTETPKNVKTRAEENYVQALNK